MLKYFNLDNFNFNDKVVGLRVDINSPIINGKVVLNERIIEHSKTIKKLSDLGAKVIILAHQGRKGKPDFISLKNHIKLLEKEVEKKIHFQESFVFEEIEKKINSMKKGDILLLENLRFLDDELNLDKKNNKIKKLEKLFELYVLDAFSIAHRNQTSVVGFRNIPNIAGLVMDKELRGLKNIESAKKPHVYIFGGAKPDDLIILMEKSLKSNSVDLVLLSGVIGEISLHLKGYNIGKKYNFFKENGFLESESKLRELLKNYSHKIILPKDVVVCQNNKRIEIPIELLNSEKGKKLVENNLIQDIGIKTVNFYKMLIRNVGSIYLKGPAGNFEIKCFEEGTKSLLKIITDNDSFNFMGGGHSVTAAKNFGYLNKFSYVSLAGGALVKFLAGEELPGIKILLDSYKRFESENYEFIVIGSNTIDTEINVSCSLKDIHLGDKVKVKEDFKKTIGGGGINVSSCLARLCSKVGYLGALSYEDIDYIKNELSKNKINLVLNEVSKKPVAKSVIIDTKDGDRVIFSYRGQNSDFKLSDKNFKLLEKTKYFYFTSLTGESFNTLNKIAKYIKSNINDSVIIYNPSLYFIKENKKKILHFLKHINILVLNLEEAYELFSVNSINDVFNYKDEYNLDVLVVTDGSRGVFAKDKNKIIHKPALKVKVVDTTGAGDSFAGTFFYFYSKGYSLEKSLEFAIINSANVVTKKGSKEGLLYLEDLEEKMKNIKL